MKANKKTRIPSLRHCNGRGFVELNGQRKYLGPWGAPETQNAYECAVAEWLANKKLPYVSPEMITVAELCREYWVHCQTYYVKSDGSPTSSLDAIKQALRPLRKQYGATLAIEIGPKAARTIQSQWIDKGLSRSTVNDRISILKRLFKWAASHEKFPSLFISRLLHSMDLEQVVPKPRNLVLLGQPLAITLMQWSRSSHRRCGH